ncbi:PPC domain-containing DNA-binding protein [Hymenobacter ginkgonis]|uniref:PPC domain-containing DNA-binding protein n=1 Tax=Hymenobacter ginkgonis TaxID=2682976 RepID=UPI00293BE358|nr:DNA-binding protein [Hymenobacter ginkgonis]
MTLLASSARAQTALPVSPTPASSLNAYALRLAPGADLRQQLLAFVVAQHIEAGTLITCVGSLTDVSLRLANQENATHYHGHFEIVSLVGTVSKSGGAHLHLSVSDSTGRTIGGHLLDGNRVYTTAEIVLGALPKLVFTRETDPTFGYKELVIRAATPAAGKPSKAKK